MYIHISVHVPWGEFTLEGPGVNHIEPAGLALLTHDLCCHRGPCARFNILLEILSKA